MKHYYNITVNGVIGGTLYMGMFGNPYNYSRINCVNYGDITINANIKTNCFPSHFCYDGAANTTWQDCHNHGDIIIGSKAVIAGQYRCGMFYAKLETASKTNVIDNCTNSGNHIIEKGATIKTEARIGGLIGWTAGYNKQNDGPVDSYINVKNCSVVNCDLKGAGSIGAIVGHAGANAATFTTIENCTVKNCNLTSTDDGGWRVGVVVGTANNGQCVINNITESGNVLSQTGKTAPAGQSNLYGRFVPAGTGTLVINGVAIN